MTPRELDILASARPTLKRLDLGQFWATAPRPSGALFHGKHVRKLVKQGLLRPGNSAGSFVVLTDEGRQRLDAFATSV